MGQPEPIRPTALVVEDDAMQREMISLLLEESEYDVLECESAEAGEATLQQCGSRLRLLITDVNLRGVMNGVELAHTARQSFPELRILVTSGKPTTLRLPDGAKFFAKPWRAIEILREAESARRAN